MTLSKKANDRDRKIDEAVKETFPASDPPSSATATSTEAPARPVERKAPIIRKEDVEAAQRGDGHKQ